MHPTITHVSNRVRGDVFTMRISRIIWVDLRCSSHLFSISLRNSSPQLTSIAAATCSRWERNVCVNPLYNLSPKRCSTILYAFLHPDTTSSAGWPREPHLHTPVEFFKTQATGVAAVDFVDGILQHLPFAVCIIFTHIRKMLERSDHDFLGKHTIGQSQEVVVVGLSQVALSVMSFMFADPVYLCPQASRSH